MTVRQQPAPASDAAFEIEDIQWPWNDFDLSLSPLIRHEPPSSSEAHPAGSVTHVVAPAQLSTRAGFSSRAPNISPAGRRYIPSHSTTAAQVGPSAPGLLDVARRMSDRLDQMVQTIETRFAHLETLLVEVRADNSAGMENAQRSIVTVDKKVNETVGRVNKLFHSLKEVQGQLPLQTRG